MNKICNEDDFLEGYRYILYKYKQQRNQHRKSYLLQRIVGFILVVLGVVSIPIKELDVTGAFITVPLGVYLLLTHKLVFKLKEVGPKVVYSKDLISSDSKIKPVYDTIPLVKLKEDEEIIIEASAKVGYGKEHAKWMPTTVCAYKQYPEITFNDDVDIDYDCADACPRGVLKSDRRSKKIKILDIENCTMCKSCVRASANGYINVGYRENDFIFRIETDGAMPPKEVLLKACDKLGEKADKFIRFSEEGGSK